MKLSSNQIMNLIDNTRLNIDDSIGDMEKWLEQFDEYYKNFATFCIYPKFIRCIRKKFPDVVKTTTVLNFPTGDYSVEDVNRDFYYSINQKVDELDYVINFHEYIKYGESLTTTQTIEQLKKKAPNKVLKVIIECGEIQSNELLKKIINQVMNAGADFVKTSTGKNKLWNYEQIPLILNEIKAFNVVNSRQVGFKVAGGIATYDEAMRIINDVAATLGEDFIKFESFRIGASRLFYNLIEKDKKG